MVIIFIKVCRSVPTNIVRVSKANPRRSTGIYLILVLGYLYINRADLWDRLFETNPYRFWYQVIRKNPQPINVSLQEYAARNRAGYCWRDKKYYSKEELWHKAMKSFTERMIYENKLYWDNELIDAGGDPRPTAADCKRSQGCRVWRIPINLTNQELKSFVGSGQRYSSKVDYLTKIKTSEVYIFATDQNFIEANFTSKNFILIQRNSVDTIYGTDCCTLLTKSEWSLIKNKNKSIYAEWDMGTFVEESRVPIDIDINSWGVGKFYLGVRSSHYFDIVNFGEGDESVLADEIFILNNCGDILYKPYYD